MNTITNIIMNNKRIYLNVVLGVAAIGLIISRQIPLAVILFVVLMAKGEIEIALRFKNNIKKGVLYALVFSLIVISAFLTLVFTQIDNETFRRILLFVL